MENLLWNLSFKKGTVASIKSKSPFEVIAKSSKNEPISMLLRDLDSNQDTSFQRAVSYH
jgi:hypothetical protein